MPAKTLKTHSGRVIVLKCIRLGNGNLLVPKKMPHNRELGDWVEVAPGSKSYKWWLPVAVDEPDPRLTPEYRKWKQDIIETERYQQWLKTLKS